MRILFAQISWHQIVYWLEFHPRQLTGLPRRRTVGFKAFLLRKGLGKGIFHVQGISPPENAGSAPGQSMSSSITSHPYDTPAYWWVTAIWLFAIRGSFSILDL